MCLQQLELNLKGQLLSHGKRYGWERPRGEQPSHSWDTGILAAKQGPASCFRTFLELGLNVSLFLAYV